MTSQATRNQLTVIMRRADMQLLHVDPPITPYYRQTALCVLRLLLLLLLLLLLRLLLVQLLLLDVGLQT